MIINTRKTYCKGCYEMYDKLIPLSDIKDCEQHLKINPECKKHYTYYDVYEEGPLKIRNKIYSYNHEYNWSRILASEIEHLYLAVIRSIAR